MNGTHPNAERLDAYVLDELDAATRTEVSAHLAGCAVCRDAVAVLEDSLAAYRRAEPAPPDDQALIRLLAAQRRLARDERRWPLGRLSTAAIAATVAAALFGAGYWTGESGSLQPVDESARPTSVRTERIVSWQPDRDLAAVGFAVADADPLGGLAARDTSWN